MLLIRRCYWSIEVSKVVQEVVHVGVEASDTFYFIPLDKGLILFIRAVLVGIVCCANIRVVKVALALDRAILFSTMHHVIIFYYVFKEACIDVII